MEFSYEIFVICVCYLKLDEFGLAVIVHLEYKQGLSNGWKKFVHRTSFGEQDFEKSNPIWKSKRLVNSSFKFVTFRSSKVVILHSSFEWYLPHLKCIVPWAITMSKAIYRLPSLPFFTPSSNSLSRILAYDPRSTTYQFHSFFNITYEVEWSSIENKLYWITYSKILKHFWHISLCWIHFLIKGLTNHFLIHASLWELFLPTQIIFFFPYLEMSLSNFGLALYLCW